MRSKWILFIFLFCVSLNGANERALMLYVEALLGELLNRNFDYRMYLEAFYADTSNTELLEAIIKNLGEKGETRSVFILGEPVFDRLHDLETKTLIADAAIELGYWEKAEKLYGKLYAEKPKDIYIGLRLAEIMAKAKKENERERILFDLLKAFPDSAEVNLAIGNYYFEKNKHKLAVKYLNKAVENQPFIDEPKELYSKLGISYKAIGKYDVAKSMFLRAIFVYKECVEERVFTELLDLLYNSGESDPTLYSMVISSFYSCYPWRKDVLFELARVYMLQRKYKNTIELLKNELESGEADVNLLSYFSWAYLGLGDTINAKWYANLAINNFPNLPQGYITLSNLYVKFEQYDLALKVLMDGLFYARKFEESIYGEMLKVLSLSKRYDECIAIGERILKRFPKNTSIIGSIAYSYFQLKDTAKCLYYYEKILKIQPDKAENLNNLGYFLAYYGKDLNRALKLTKEAVKKEPYNPSYIDSYGWALFKLGRIREAEFQIVKSLILDRSNGTIWEHLGDIYYKRGMIEEARAVWKKALELGNLEDREALLQKLDSLE